MPAEERTRHSRRTEARRALIERLWSVGWTAREIAEEIGSTAGSVEVAIHRMRAQGRDVPYRRPRAAP